jgi:hypothetical protein
VLLVATPACSCLKVGTLHCSVTIRSLTLYSAFCARGYELESQFMVIVMLELRTKSLKKNALFWDVAPCDFIINRRFGGTCRLHLQGRRNNSSEEKLDGSLQKDYSSGALKALIITLEGIFLVSEVKI